MIRSQRSIFYTDHIVQPKSGKQEHFRWLSHISRGIYLQVHFRFCCPKANCPIYRSVPIIEEFDISYTSATQVQCRIQKNSSFTVAHKIGMYSPVTSNLTLVFCPFAEREKQPFSLANGKNAAVFSRSTNGQNRKHVFFVRLLVARTVCKINF